MKLAEFDAIIFDVDGTLYRHAPIRRAMAARLALIVARRPRQGLATIRALRAYREAHERLREVATPPADIAQAQVELAAARVGLPEAQVSVWVAHWIHHAPLPHLAKARQPGLVDFLHAAKEHGKKLGVLSDYPAVAKLSALGLLQFFDVVVSAQDFEVQRLKPHPRGLEMVLRRLQVSRHQALYIGDRTDTDAAVATRAGVACLLIGRARRLGESAPASALHAASFRELHAHLNSSAS